MSGVIFTVALEDFAAVSGLELMAAAGEDLTGLMAGIGSVLINGAVERIGVTNVTPEGVAWPKSLRAKEAGGPTLHDTGRLMRSITAEAGPRQVRVGSNLIYAGVHQTGAKIVPKTKDALYFTLANGTKVVAQSVTIPARPYLGISVAEADTIVETIRNWFDAKLGGAVQ